MTYSFQDRPGQSSDPPIKNENNHIFRRIRVHPPSYLRYMQPECTTYIESIYMGYAACDTLQSLGLLLFRLRSLHTSTYIFAVIVVNSSPLRRTCVFSHLWVCFPEALTCVFSHLHVWVCFPEAITCVFSHLHV